jgi:hypothetical protein
MEARMKGKSAALDVIAILRAMRNGNTPLANNIASRHLSDASELLKHSTAISLAFLDALDCIAADHDTTDADDMLANLHGAILQSADDQF